MDKILEVQDLNKELGINENPNAITIKSPVKVSEIQANLNFKSNYF